MLFRRHKLVHDNRWRLDRHGCVIQLETACLLCTLLATQSNHKSMLSQVGRVCAKASA